MTTDHLTLDTLRLRGHQALFRELGPVGFARFMQQFVSRGNYTKEREAWIDQIDLADLEGRAPASPPAPPHTPNGKNI